MKKLLCLSVMIIMIVCLLTSCDLILNHFPQLGDIIPGGGTGGDHTHAYDEWESVSAPTCTEEGIREKMCVCGDVVRESVPALGHIYAIDIGTAATCDAPGLSEGAHCSICNATIIEQKVIPALGHNYIANVISEHSYDADTGISTVGYTTYTCATCEDFYTVTVDHNYSAYVVEATCQSQGYTIYSCACGFFIMSDYTAFADHTPGKTEYASIPEDACPCEWQYTIYIYCNTCGINYTTIVSDPMGHIWPDNPGTDYTVINCTNCTCCVMTNPNAGHSHSWGDWIPTINTTETSPCEWVPIYIRTCSSCGEIEYEERGVAPGHKFVGGACEICGREYPNYVPENPGYSVGLEYQLSYDGTYYTVISIGTCTDTKIVFPNTYNSLPVKEISWGAFRNDGSVRSFVIPESMTNISIGMASLHPFGNVSEIIVNENNPIYKSIDGNLYTKDGKTLLVYSCAKSNRDFVIPSHVTTIGLSAFWGANNLEYVVIPNTVTTVEFYALSISTVFYTGTSEEWNKITIDDSNYGLIDSLRYYYSETQPTEEGNFWHYVDGIPTVWNETIVAGLYDSNNNLLATWDDLVNIYGLDVEQDYAMCYTPDIPTHINYIMQNYDELKTGTKLIVGSSVKKIGDWGLCHCYDFTELYLPDGLLSIGEHAVTGWPLLTEITIPDSVTYIGMYAFEWCTSLQYATLSEDLVTIDCGAFDFCESLQGVYMSNNVTNINFGVFTGCNSLSYIAYSGNESDWANISVKCDLLSNKLKDGSITILYNSTPEK